MKEKNSTTESIIEDLSPTTEQGLISMIYQRWNTADTFRSPLKDKWDIYYKYYRNYRNEKDYVWESNLAIPTAFYTIESLLPRIIAILFGPKFLLNILPRKKEDEVSAPLVEKLIKMQLDGMKSFKLIYDWFKIALIYGTSVIKLFWDFRVVKRIVSVPQYILGIKVGYKQVEKDVIEYDDPCAEVMDLYDFFIDPRATSVADARWCMQRYWRDYDYLVQKEKDGVYKNVDQVKAGVGNIDEITKNVRAEVSGTPTGTITDDKNKVEIWEYWENNRVVVLANRSVLLRDEKNPFWHGKKPFIDIKDISLPHEFYGIGEIEPIESLLNERNELRNQVFDNIKTIVNKIIVADRNADLDFERLEENNRPGGVILTDKMDAIKYLEPTNIISDFYRIDAMILKDIQDASAMSEQTVGNQSSRRETATSVMQVQASASTRFSLKIQNMVFNGVSELIKMMIQLDQQFISKPRLIRMFGEKGYEFKEITSDDISSNYDFESQVGMMEVNKDVRRQEMLLLANLPIFTNMPNTNIEELQKMILTEFDKDADRIIKPMPTQIPGQPGAMDGLPNEGQKKNKEAPGLPSVKGVGGIPVPRS